MEFNSAYDKLTFEYDAFSDERGVLTIAGNTEGKCLPFEVQRVFWIHGVPASCQRGMHAHRTCWEALSAVSGSFKVRVSNGMEPPVTFLLDNPQKGLLIPPMVWCELFDFSADAVCLCLASGHYDQTGYISNYEDFLHEVSQLQKPGTRHGNKHHTL